MTDNQEPGNDAALKALAAQADAEGWEGDTTVEPAESAPAQEKSTPKGSENQEGETEVTTSQEQSQPEKAQEAETQKEIDYRAEYERLKKENERQDRSWKRINEEKEALARVRATTRPDETRYSGDQFSAEEYESYANKLIKEGAPYEQIEQAANKARSVRQESMKERFQKSMQDAIDEDPELATQESPLAKAVQEVFRDPDWGHFKSAVKLAKAKQLADSIPGLKGEIENYKKEIERLNKAMEVGGKPGLPKRETPKRFEDMDIKEMTEHIRRRAEEVDENSY